MEYSEDELDFIRKYEIDNEKKVVVKKRRKIKLTKLFYTWIGFLAVTPFVLATIFLIAMAKLNSIFESSGVKDLTKDLSPTEVQNLAQQTGFKNIDSYVNIYRDRLEIVAGIFTVFIVLIAISFVLRILALSLANRKEVEENDEN